jgi:hypothetical protein
MNKDPKKFIHENNNLGPEDEAVISFLLKSEPEIKPSPLFVQNLKEKIATQKIITVRPSPYVFFMEYRYAFSLALLLLIFTPIAFQVTKKQSQTNETLLETVNDTSINSSATMQMEMSAPENSAPAPTTLRKTAGGSIEEVLHLAITKQEKIKPESLVITNIQEKTWPDACLGLAAPDEMCTQALVVGFSIEALVDGKSALYRSDTSGTILIKEE